MTLVHDDLARNVPGLGPTTTRRLIGFAIAGAGVGNMWSAVAQVQKGDMAMYGRLLRRWSANRTLTEFYEDLFERYGYTCEQVRRLLEALFGLAVWKYKAENLPNFK